MHWRWEITRLVLWRVHWLYRLTEASEVTSKHDFSSAWLTGMLFRAEDTYDLVLLGKSLHMERFLN